MRERVKGVETTVLEPSYVTWYDASGAVKAHDVWNGIRGISTIHKIIDDPSPMPKPRITRHMAHYTCDMKGVMVTQEWYGYQGASDYYRGSYPINAPTDQLVFPDVSSIHNEALQFFKAGCVDLSFDLSADLLEWKQIRTLLPSLRTSLHDLFQKAAIRNVRHLARNLKKRTKATANLHLAYAFGISPLISDISSFVSCVRGLQDKITFLRKNNGKVLPVRFRKDISISTCPTTSVLVDDSVSYAYIKPVEYRAFYQAHARITYDVSQLSDLELKLRYFCRSLGLDKPLSTLWELTPWSFLVDWILSIGNWIDELTPSISIPYKFQDLGYSIKVIRTDDYVVERRIPKTNAKASVRGTRTAYFRQRGIPASFSSLDFGDLTLRKLALSASLAAQRWR